MNYFGCGGKKSPANRGLIVDGRRIRISLSEDPEHVHRLNLAGFLEHDLIKQKETEENR
jgi:hypothetical protein